MFAAQPKTVYMLHNTEQPASCFAITDSGLCLTADTLFDGLMHKLKNYYPQRKNAKMEAKGQRFEYSDFILKVGSVALAGGFKGIVVEVHILALSIKCKMETLLLYFHICVMSV